MSQTLELGAYGSSIPQGEYEGPVVLDTLEMRPFTVPPIYSYPVFDRPFKPIQFNLKFETTPVLEHARYLKEKKDCDESVDELYDMMLKEATLVIPVRIEPKYAAPVTLSEYLTPGNTRSIFDSLFKRDWVKVVKPAFEVDYSGVAELFD